MGEHIVSCMRSLQTAGNFNDVDDVSQPFCRWKQIWSRDQPNLSVIDKRSVYVVYLSINKESNFLKIFRSKLEYVILIFIGISSQNVVHLRKGNIRYSWKKFAVLTRTDVCQWSARFIFTGTSHVSGRACCIQYCSNHHLCPEMGRAIINNQEGHFHFIEGHI